MKLDADSIKAIVEEMQREYNFEPAVILDIIKSAIKTAYKKDFLPNDRKAVIHVAINAEGKVQIYREYLIVDEVEDAAIEITRADAEAQGSPIEITSSFFANVTPEDLQFRRIGAQAAAQTVKQQIKQIEKQRFFDKFQDKQGELLRGKVLRVSDYSVVLDIDNTSVLLPKEGQIPNRPYHIGEDITVLLNTIEKGSGGIMLDVTQSSPDFVEAILFENIPELTTQQVEIVKIARMAGIKSKVMVRALDDKVDPIGIFLGQYGMRMEVIQQAMSGERVDFVEYTDDLEVFLQHAFKPVHLHGIAVQDDIVTISVDSDKKAMAIGKRASNVRLIGQLIDYKIVVE